LKTIVYDNYKKFTDTSETIGRVGPLRCAHGAQINASIADMEGDMTELSLKIAEITSKSDAISSNLAERRTKIEKLNAVRKLLKKAPPPPRSDARSSRTCLSSRRGLRRR
jgi:hypothetical protein